MKTVLSRFTLLLLTLSFTFSSCAGRAAHPVMIRQYGDKDLSVEALEMQIAMVEEEIIRRMPKTDKTGKNIALGVAGAFLLVPWFFMDFSQAEQIEIDALRLRYNHLVTLAHEKGSSKERELIPEIFKKKEKKKSTTSK